MALIKTIEEFRKWVKVNMSIEDLEAYLGDIYLVEDEQIRKYLGAAFYEELDEKYNTDQLTDRQKKLLDFLQLAIANLAQESYTDINQVHISESGIQIISDEKRKTAFQWQINALRNSFLRKGYNGLERALEYLEENIDHADFATWKTSTAATVFQQHFINTAKEFSAEYNIKNSRLTFLGLLPILKKLEGFALEPVLGPELFLEIKTQLKTRDVSADNKFLLESFIRPALSHLVAAKALVEEGFKLTPQGLELSFARLDDGSRKDAGAETESLLNRKIREAHQDGQAFLVKLKDYLNKNASAERYPTYFTSSTYAAPGGEPVVFRNPANTRVFGVI